VPHALNALIVEIDVRDFDVRGQTFGLNCKPVVVRRDLRALSSHFLHWLIAATMSENEFESLAAKSASE
jgi:hypothetical protein